jgi:hypothetical protein
LWSVGQHNHASRSKKRVTATTKKLPSAKRTVEQRILAAV